MHYACTVWSMTKYAGLFSTCKISKTWPNTARRPIRCCDFMNPRTSLITSSRRGKAIPAVELVLETRTWKPSSTLIIIRHRWPCSSRRRSLSLPSRPPRLLRKATTHAIESLFTSVKETSRTSTPHIPPECHHLPFRSTTPRNNAACARSALPSICLANQASRAPNFVCRR